MKRLVRLPGVYPPQEDTWLLAEALGREPIDSHTRILDLCTGTGALALRAAAAGGVPTAIDVSSRAILNTRINAGLQGRRLRVLRGDLASPVCNERFEYVVSNPPYVPAEGDALPTRGIERAWDAGKDGRALIDRICEQAPDVLTENGVLLLAQSTFSGEDKTRLMLEERGMTVQVVARAEIRFGRVLAARSALLEDRGVIDVGQCTEEIVVIRGEK